MPYAYTQSTVITPNALLSRQLRREYDAGRRQEGLRVWESADILPRGAWLERIWRECVYRDPVNMPVLLSPLQERTLWEEAIAQADAGDVLLDLPATATTAARAWNLLHSWEVRIEPAEFGGLRDPEAFLDWYRFLERRLWDQNWITPAQLPKALMAKISRAALPRAVAYAGFDELTPADRRLFAACDATPVETHGVSSHAGRIACAGSAGELLQAAWWARRRLEANPGARLGVAVRGLAGQSAIAERIFDDTLHPGPSFARAEGGRAFQVSAGTASAEIPLISAALGVLRLKTGIPLAEAERLLRAPFLGLERAGAAALAVELRRQGFDHVSLDAGIVRHAFPNFARAAEQLRARQHPGEWSADISKLLTRAGWPGRRPLSAEEQNALEHWKQILSDFASLDMVLPRMPYAEAVRRLRQIARDRRMLPNDEAAPVQVLDLLEAPGLRFDGLWIAGLDASGWPETPRPNPFLPASVQRAAGLPHSSAEHELACARRITSRLLQSAPEVTCSWARASGEEALRVSPLIESLPEIAAVGPPDSIAGRIFSAGAVLEEHSQTAAPPLTPGVMQRGGMSVLKDQAACPFRAFAIHRLGAKQPDAPELGISAAERGSIAHQALDLFWQEVQSQDRLCALSPPELTALVERSVNAALDARLSRRHHGKPLERARVLEYERCKKLVLEWLAFEKHRDSFEVIESEVARKVEVAELTIEIRADRIDRFPDGTFGILDYKTTDKLSPKQWDGDRPDAPQLPLYAVKCGRKVSAVHFVRLVPGAVKRIGLQGAPVEALLENWRRVIERLGANFARGEAGVDPKDGVKTCEFCDLPALCRIGELRGASEVEEEGE